MISDVIEKPSTNLNLINAALFLLRSILIADKSSNIELVMKLEFIEKFNNLLDLDSTTILENSLWCLINITAESIESVMSIIKLEMHKKLISKLDSMKNSCLNNVIFR